MSTTSFQRGLDLAPTATIDKVALNNKVVLMRAVVRRSKLHLINGLVKKVHKLREKKGSEAQKKQNKNKSERMLEDIKIIKVLKPDYVSKYALSTTVKFEEVAAKAGTTAEMRALARLAAHKFIMQEVDKFRQEHPDWKDLAAYLMTKHTSREFKKKKIKEKMKKVEANVIASENLVQEYLGEKLAGRTDLEDENDDFNDEHVSDGNGNDNDDDNVSDDLVNDDDDEIDDSSSELEEIHERTKKATKKNKDNSIEKVKLDKENVDEETDNSDDDDDDDDIVTDDVNDDKECEDDQDDDDDDVVVDIREKDKAQLSEKVKNKKSAKEKNTSKARSKSKSSMGDKITHNVPKKIASTEKVEGEMIVRKLNLAKDFVDEDIPKILLNDSEDKLVKHKKKKKDLFFVTGEDYDSGNPDGDEHEVSNSDDFKEAENDELENESRENYERSIQPTMTAFTTCFVGSLKSSDMMRCNDSQYRSNEDWKRIRHEMNEQKLGRSRGRGQAPAFRGRGQAPAFRGRGQAPAFRGRGQAPAFRGRGQAPAFRGRGSSNNFVSHRGRGFADHPGGREFSGGPRGRGHAGSGRGSRGRGGFEGYDHTKEPAAIETKSKKSSGLHPSWEASKKRKQEQKAVLKAFEGKKIKFDD